MAFQVQQLNVGGYDHNFSYLVVADNGDAALVDPTGDCEKIRRAVEAAGPLTPRYILLTHGHQDHSECLGEVCSFFSGRDRQPPESSAFRTDQAA